jgi:hypothetical protein
MNLAELIRRFGTLTLLNFSRKTVEKVEKGSDPEVPAFAAPLKTAIGELELAYAVRRPLRALWMAATAAKDAADDSLDNSIGGLSYDLLSPSFLNKNRRHPDYLALFPEGNIDFIHGADRKEVVQVNAMVAYLKATPTHPMASRATELETKVVALDDALKPMVDAEDALRAAEAVEKGKRQNLCRALRKVQAQLHSHFMDKKKEDAFFPTVAEYTVEEDDEPAAPAV